MEPWLLIETLRLPAITLLRLLWYASLDELMDGDALIATDGKPEGDKLGSLVDKYDGNAEGFEDCCIVGSSEGVTVGAAEGRFVGDIDGCVGAPKVGVKVIIGFVVSSSS